MGRGAAGRLSCPGPAALAAALVAPTNHGGATTHASRQQRARSRHTAHPTADHIVETFHIPLSGEQCARVKDLVLGEPRLADWGRRKWMLQARCVVVGGVGGVCVWWWRGGAGWGGGAHRRWRHRRPTAARIRTPRCNEKTLAQSDQIASNRLAGGGQQGERHRRRQAGLWGRRRRCSAAAAGAAGAAPCSNQPLPAAPNPPLPPPLAPDGTQTCGATTWPAETSPPASSAHSGRTCAS